MYCGLHANWQLHLCVAYYIYTRELIGDMSYLSSFWFCRGKGGRKLMTRKNPFGAPIAVTTRWLYYSRRLKPRRTEIILSACGRGWRTVPNCLFILLKRSCDAFPVHHAGGPTASISWFLDQSFGRKWISQIPVDVLTNFHPYHCSIFHRLLYYNICRRPKNNG